MHHCTKQYIIALLSMLACACLFCSAASAEIEWNIEQRISLPEEPRDLAISRDGKTLYVLCEKSVQIYSITADKITGTIPLEHSCSEMTISPDENTLYVTDSKNSTVTQIHIAKIFDIPVGDSPVLGNKGAPVSLVAFLDIQCPYCARVFPTLEKVLEAHPEKVKVVIKHFPLRMHRFARQAARASLAAAQQEAYLPMLKKLFADARHLNESKISSFVEQLGLDKDRFEKAYKGSSAAQQVSRDMQLGRSVGVRGVPALFINGRAAKRRSFQALSAMIQQEIKQE